MAFLMDNPSMSIHLRNWFSIIAAVGAVCLSSTFWERSLLALHTGLAMAGGPAYLPAMMLTKDLLRCQ